MAGSVSIKKASILPLIATVIFILGSVVLYVMRAQIANNSVFVAGYLLTPIGVTATMAWDLLAQRKGQVNPNFDVRPLYSALIKWLVVAGFVIGAFHIYELGTILGQWFVQNGWLQ